MRFTGELKRVRSLPGKRPLPDKNYYHSVECRNTIEVDAKYELQKVLGYGAYGMVCSAIDTQTNERVALMKSSDVFDHVMITTRALREIGLRKKIDHPNFLKLKDVLLAGFPNSFEDVYFVQELMPNDLRNILREFHISTTECKHLMFQLLRGLEYLHAENVMHRDLKPANVLVNNSGALKICDFGLTRTPSELGMTSEVEALGYRAPELLLQVLGTPQEAADRHDTWGHYDAAIDIWSAGCIFAQLLAEGSPQLVFKAVSEPGLLRAISQKENESSTLSERKAQKEKEAAAPPEKKRKLTLTDDNSKQRLATKNNDRESVAAVSVKQEWEDPFQSVTINRPEQWDENKMHSTEVEALLNMKMAGKSKCDIKGKTEQMMDYIKKLRDCIRYFLTMEAVYILHVKQLNDQLMQQRREQEEMESGMELEKEKLEEKIAQLKQQCSTLGGELATAKTEKEELLQMHEKDLEAMRVSGNERLRLLDEIGKLKNEVSMSNEQIKSLHDISKQQIEHNTSLQVYNSKLQTEAASAIEENLLTKQEKASILETLSSVRVHAAALQDQLENAKETALEWEKQRIVLNEEIERLHVELQRTVEDRSHCMSQIKVLTEENEKFREYTGKSTCELEILTNKAIALEESYRYQKEQVKCLHQQLDVAHQKLQMADATIAQQKQEEAGYLSKVQSLQARLSEAENQLHEGELLRRKLHNTIQELKGNIRVFCRVRPMLCDDEGSSSELPVVQYPNSMDLEGRSVELIQPQHGQKYAFSFDKVFGPETTQEDIFVDISQLVQSALDGYKVCIFAYGQTGSGKTYTMLGHPEESRHKGLIPRSLEQIFTSSQALCSQGWSFKMQASMLEIYNETIWDLLGCYRNNSYDTGKQHIVKHDANGNTFVSDLTIVEVTKWEEVSSLLKQAAQSRTVGRTAMNEQSSRSHCVFSLRIAGRNENTEQRVHGVLNLVDLAGSERLSKSGATGERLKETQAINKSLSSLGDVIMAIANKEQHIPYRNSRLTYLLQPCLGGDSKTLMFVNISPDPKSFGESLCSLRFAAKVKTCEIGVPRRQTNSRFSDNHGRLSNS